MSNLAERTLVACNYGPTSSHLNRYLDNLEKIESGSRPALKLTVDFTDVSLSGGLILSRHVLIEFPPVQYHEAHRPVTIRWQLEGGGLFPTFTGALTVRFETFGCSWLLLTGSFDLREAVGLPFDLETGQLIAHATATALLSKLRSAIERTRLQLITG